MIIVIHRTLVVTMSHSRRVFGYVDEWTASANTTNNGGGSGSTLNGSNACIWRRYSSEIHTINRPYRMLCVLCTMRCVNNVPTVVLSWDIVRCAPSKTPCTARAQLETHDDSNNAKTQTNNCQLSRTPYPGIIVRAPRIRDHVWQYVSIRRLRVTKAPKGLIVY